MTTQENIQNLIQQIISATQPNSVSNTMVGTILEYLFEASQNELRSLIRTDDATDEESTVHHDLKIEGGATIAGDARFFQNALTRMLATFGNYSNAVAGHITGAAIDSDGNGCFANLRANSMEVFELVYNRIRANGGRQVYSGACGKVDSVELYEADEENGDKYVLHMHVDADNPNDKTEFSVGDILYSYINDVASSGVTSTGQCWMHVLSVNTSGRNNYVLAQMYKAETDDGDAILPVATNKAPAANMVVAQWGNITNTDRQTSFYIDTELGSIMQLMNVDSPLITVANYGAIMGKLPQDLREYIYAQGGGTINPNQPYFYGRGAVLQDVIRIDFTGQIVRARRERGEWSSETAALTADAGGYTVTPSMYDVVSWNGCEYKCLVNYPDTATSEPGTDADEWMLIFQGGGASLSIYELVVFPNAIKVHPDRISPQSDVHVYVRKTTTSGVEDITESDDLEELGMRIEYCVDDGEREELTISDGEIVDDGGEPIVGDNGQPIIQIEGEGIDATTVQDHITVFLVDDDDNDLREYVIPVVHDGETLPGPQGYSVTSISEVYALVPVTVATINASTIADLTEEYDLEWTETVPTWQTGYNLWNAIRTVYGENDDVLIHNFHNLGEGILSVMEQYCIMSGLTNPDSLGTSPTWSTTLVQPTEGQSLWNREKRTFIGGGDHDTYTAAQLVTYVGINGTNFIPIGSAYDGATAPDGASVGDYWYDTSVSPAVVKQYNGTSWALVTLNAGDAFKLVSNNHLVVWNGTSWADLGSIAGADGNGIKDSYEVWQWTASADISSVDDDEWQDTIGTYTTAKPYLWNATCFEFDRGVNLYTDKECLGEGVANSVEYYCAKPDGVVPTVPSHSSSDVTHAEMISAGWALEKPTLNDSNSRVMWNTELVSYLDGRKARCTSPSNIYRYTVDGTVITDITEVYAMVPDTVVVDAGNASNYTWTTTVPNWQSGKKLWNAMMITYDGQPKYYDFEDLGVGVSSVEEQYAITTGIVTPTSGWSTSRPSTLEKGEALWNREHIYYRDGRTGVSGRTDYTSASLVTYVGMDGTKFMPKGVAYSSVYRTWLVGEYYYDSTRSNLSERIRRCTTAGSSTGAVFATVELTEGDAYKIEETGHLLVWSGATWVDLGSIIGPAGDDGTSITGSTEVYQWTNSANRSSVSSSWSTSVPAYNSNKPYLWNATKITYSNGSYDIVSVECLGDGVSTVTEYYKSGQDSSVSIAVPTKSNGNVTDGDMVAAGWSQTKPVLSESAPCMWNTELRTFYDSRYASCTPSAIIYRYSKDGDSGQSKYKANIFKRSVSQPTTPSGGTYGQSLTSSMASAGWSDGIPAADESKPSSVWMSSRLFTSDGVGQDSSWSTPVRVMDTDTLDVQFSDMADYLPIALSGNVSFNRDTDFTGGKTVYDADGDSVRVYSYAQAMSALGWIDAEGVSESSIWMAVNKKIDGAWKGWSYIKVKGEQGGRGPGIADMTERYLLLPSGLDKASARELYDLELAQDEPYYDSAHPDYDLWNAIVAVDDDGEERIYDLHNLGAGIKDVIEYYRLTANNTAPSFGASSLTGWNTNMATVTQARTSSQHCLWNAERITYIAEDKPDQYTTPSLIGYYGNDGSSFNVLGKIHDADGYTPSANEPVYTVSVGVIDVFAYDSQGHDHSVGAQGDAYVALDEPYENHLFYYNGTAWIDLGSIAGPKGDQGDPGKDAVQVELSETSVFVPVDPVTAKTSSRKIVTFTAKLLKGGTAQAITSRTVTLTGLDSAITPSITNGTNQISVTVTIPVGTATTGSARCRVYLNNATLNISAFADLHIVFVQRGKDGDIGLTGPMLYPAGTYDPAVAALGQTGYYNDGTATPYVLDKDGNYYWRTTNPYRKTGGATWNSSNGVNAILDPSVDYSLGGDTAWRKIEKMESVFTKILFANFANLGRAVFWGTYMFSEYGQKADGTVCRYDQVENIDGQHIFTDGKLNGTWLPALYLDLQSGLIRTAKLSEPFIELPLARLNDDSIEEDVTYRSIDLDGAHNLTVVPRCNYNPGQSPAFSPFPALVVLPRQAVDLTAAELASGRKEWSEDGAHVTIVHQFDPQFVVMGEGANSSPAYLTESSVVMVCADERVLKRATYVNQQQTDNVLDRDDDAWIIWKGRRTKFVLLSVGEQLRLRSCRTRRAGADYIYWYVENSCDFEEVSAYISVCQGYTDLGAYYPHSAGGLLERYPIIGSPRLNAITAVRDSYADPADGYKLGYVLYVEPEDGERAIDILDHYN